MAKGGNFIKTFQQIGDTVVVDPINHFGVQRHPLLGPRFCQFGAKKNGTNETKIDRDGTHASTMHTGSLAADKAVSEFREQVEAKPQQDLKCRISKITS